VTSRIQKLRDGLFEKIPGICPERAVLFTESMKKSEGQPIVKRRAQSLQDVLGTMTIFVRDGELLVGNQASSVRAAPVFPEYSTDWIVSEFAGEPYHFMQRPCDQFSYTEEAKNQILETIDYWQNKTLIRNVWSQLPEQARVAWEINAIDDTWCAAAGLGNVLPDHEMVLREGLNGVIAQARKRLSELDLAEPGAISQYWFLQAVVTANEAVITFANRFAAHLDILSRDQTARGQTGASGPFASTVSQQGPLSPCR